MAITTNKLTRVANQNRFLLCSMWLMRRYIPRNNFILLLNSEEEYSTDSLILLNQSVLIWRLTESTINDQPP